MGPADRRAAASLALLLLLGPDAAAGDPPITLVVGAQRLLPTPRAVRVAVGAPEVVAARAVDGGRAVILTGVGPGTTTVTLWDRSGAASVSTVDVVPHDPERLRREIEDLLQGIEGLTVRTAGLLVVLDGALHRPGDRERVARVASLYPQARDLTRPSPLLHRAVADRVNRELAAAGLTGVTAVPGHGGLVLEGRAGSAAEVERAGRIAAAHAGAVTNLVASGVPDAPMVLLDVRFLELARTALTQVGVQWSEAIAATATLSGPLGSAGSPSASGSLEAAILALAREGRARVLANPRLVTRSGEPADFLAGGEIPIALVGERESSLVWRPYGIQLECTPEAEPGGRIAARLSVEVSTLDRANGVPQAPALATRRVRTTFTVRTGETIALSGLLSADASKDVRRVPGVGRIPVLGELFKSRAWQARESELVVFVTPTLRQPASTLGDEAALAGMADRYRRAGRALVPRLSD
jgi:pilus assembly protein CpaC